MLIHCPNCRRVIAAVKPLPDEPTENDHIEFIRRINVKCTTCSLDRDEAVVASVARAKEYYGPLIKMTPERARQELDEILNSW